MNSSTVAPASVVDEKLLTSDVPISRYDPICEEVRPLKASVTYHGAYDCPEFTSQELVKMTVSDMRQYYSSAIPGVQEPFDIPHAVTVPDLLKQLSALGVPEDIRLQIIELLAADDFAPKFKFIRSETAGNISVVVSHALPFPIDRTSIEKPQIKKKSSSGHGFGT